MENATTEYRGVCWTYEDLATYTDALISASLAQHRVTMTSGRSDADLAETLREVGDLLSARDQLDSCWTAAELRPILGPLDAKYGTLPEIAALRHRMHRTVETTERQAYVAS